MIAGIVAYNPDAKRLLENVLAIYNQVEEVVLVDNGSSDLSYLNELSSIELTIIKNNDNLGIAKALNQILYYAYEYGYSWAITLDDDSVAPMGLVDEYKCYINNDEIGMIVPRILDRNFGMMDDEASEISNTSFVEMAITSASCVKVSAWKNCKGFCDKLFIDSVDFDFCYRLKECGYKILKTHKVSLIHEVGHSTKVKFMGHEACVFNHSPLRYYYIVRNQAYIGIKHRKPLLWCWSIIRLFLLVSLYEDNRKAKLSKMLLGLWHFVINKYGKLNH